MLFNNVGDPWYPKLICLGKCARDHCLLVYTHPKILICKLEKTKKNKVSIAIVFFPLPKLPLKFCPYRN